MEAAKKKPGLALVVSMGKAKGEGESEGSGEEYGAAVDELADVLGVAEDQREAFASAFEAAIMSCK